MQNIEKGNHDDKECKEYRKKYIHRFDQELPCEYKGNNSKIQKLLRKVQIDQNGSVTEIQFESKSLQTKLKNLFRRK